MAATGASRAFVRRIMIIGGPGAGKSVLAGQLGQITGLPVVALDALAPGQGDAPALDAARADAWILDGNHPSTWPYRMSRAHLIVFLDLTPGQRLWQTVRRGLVRGGFPDAATLAAIHAYDGEGRAAALRLIDDCQRRGRPRCVVLRNPAAIRWFVQVYPARFAHI